MLCDHFVKSYKICVVFCLFKKELTLLIMKMREFDFLALLYYKFSFSFFEGSDYCYGDDRKIMKEKNNFNFYCSVCFN